MFCFHRNRVTHLIRKAAKRHASTLHRASRLSPSPESSQNFWKFVRRITGRSAQKPNPQTLPDPVTAQAATTAEEQAGCFNSHFARQTMLGVPDDETPSSRSLQFNTLSFSYLSATPSDVYGILSKLKSGKAPGIDHITPILIFFSIVQTVLRAVLHACSTGVLSYPIPTGLERSPCNSSLQERLRDRPR